MFSRIIEYLKGVFARMFGKDQITRVTGRQVTLSSEMLKALDRWQRMLEGHADWVETDPDGVKSLGIEQAICREFTNISVSEMETSLENQNIDVLYQNALEDLVEEMEFGLGLGSFAIKPIGATGNVEYIPANRIIPIEYGDDGKLKCCAFIQIKPIGDTDVYYRLEVHELTQQGLHIINKAFKGNKGEFGHEISLTDVDEWANLIPEVTYSGMDRMDFGYYRNPIANKIDYSKNGVSIFESATENIRKADIQFGRVDWEYSSGERMVMADYQAVERKTDYTGRPTFKAPKGKERMYVGVDTGQGDFWHDHSPVLRDANYISGLNEYLRRIEFNVGLAYGDLSKNEAIEKTAQEIKSSKQRKYNMVNSIQKKLKICLEDLAYAIAFYQAQYTTHIGFECTFHDSILTDEDTERANDRIDVSNGTMTKVEYRMKWYGEDEHTAREKLAEAIAEMAAYAEGDIQ